MFISLFWSQSPRLLRWGRARHSFAINSSARESDKLDIPDFLPGHETQFARHADHHLGY
jgi:hypothetical protein